MGGFMSWFSGSGGGDSGGSSSSSGGGFFSSSFCSAYNDSSTYSGIDTYSSFGYVEPLLGPVGLGGSVTFTASGDVLLSGVAGTGGPIISAGMAPAGQSATSYLSGAGMSFNPAGAAGTLGVTTGVPLSDSAFTPTIGTPGASASYTASVGSIYCGAVDSLNSAVSNFTNAVNNVYNQAVRYGSGAIMQQR